MVVVRLTSCKQAELDAALGQMTVKSKACRAGSDMPRRRQQDKRRYVYNGVTINQCQGER